MSAMRSRGARSGRALHAHALRRIAKHRTSVRLGRLTPGGEQDTVKTMEVTMRIPDDIANRIAAAGGDLSRRALEALVAEEYRQGRLHKPDLRRLLGFETSDEIDGFLRAHQVFEDYSLEDLERELEGLKRLGV